MKSVRTFLRQRLIRNNLIKAAVLVAVCVSAGMIIPRFLTISVSPSLGQRVFLLNNNGKGFKAGDVVRFSHADVITGGETVFMLKRIGCMPGQHLLVDKQKDYYCDGQYLGRAKGITRKGEPIRNFSYDGVVPEGVFFALANHKDSYDSRYYGFVGQDRVVAKAYPLF